jgi:hypothetical protein
MSQGMVGKARNELVEKGLIVVSSCPTERGGRSSIRVTIVDIWQSNDASYTSPSTPGELASSCGVLPSTPGELKKNPSKNKRISHADPRTSHPAVQAVLTITGKNPTKDCYDMIIEKLGEEPDIKKLRTAWTAWRARDYKPTNLGWLDWYKDGVPTFRYNGKGLAEKTPEAVWKEAL